MLQIFRVVFHFFYLHFIVITDFLLCSAHFIRRAYTFSRRDAKVFYDFLVCLRIFCGKSLKLSVVPPFHTQFTSISAPSHLITTDFSRKLSILSVSCNFSHLIVQKSNPKLNAKLLKNIFPFTIKICLQKKITALL